MKRIICLLVCSVLCGIANAEFRVWKDKKGNSIEAELVTVNATTVVIRNRKGKIMKFPPSKLCAADQKYIQDSIPPKIEIEFKKNQDRRNTNYGSSANVLMTGEVKVIKAEQRPCNWSLKVVLMVIGESKRDGEFIVLDKSESAFDFKTSREFSMEGSSFSMYQLKYTSNYGVEYEGFLVVVMDDSGKVLKVKSSKKDYEANYAKVLKFNHKDRFTRKFKKSTTTTHYTSGDTFYY